MSAFCTSFEITHQSFVNASGVIFTWRVKNKLTLNAKEQLMNIFSAHLHKGFSSCFVKLRFFSLNFSDTNATCYFCVSCHISVCWVWHFSGQSWFGCFTGSLGYRVRTRILTAHLSQSFGRKSKPNKWFNLFQEDTASKQPFFLFFFIKPALHKISSVSCTQQIRQCRNWVMVALP